MYLFFHSLYADIRALPRAVYILIAGQFLNKFGSYVYPFLTLYLNSIGYSASSVASVIAVMGVGNIFGPLVGGYLADAIGRKRTIAISLFGSAFATLGIYTSTGYYWGLLLFSFANGFLWFMYGPAASALMTDLVPSEKRLTAYAMFRLALNGGFAAGPAVGGILYITAPWLVFFGDALTTIMCGFLILAYLPHGLRTIQERAGSFKVFLRSWKEALIDLGNHALFKQYLLALMFMALGFCQVFSVLALSAKDSGLSAREYGLVMSWNGLLILLVELPISHWLKRFESKRVLTVGFALIGIGLGVFGIVDTFTGFIGAMTVFTIGEIIALPVGMAYSSDLAPVKYRGRYLGLRGIIWGVAGCLASGGLVIQNQIGPGVWVIAGVSGLLSAILISLPVSGSSKMPGNEEVVDPT
ncbi:MAG: MFS transporter [Verrucomicrobiota bacterium]